MHGLHAKRLLLTKFLCTWTVVSCYQLTEPSLVAQTASCQCRKLRIDSWVRKFPLKRKWQPTPIFLSEKSHGQRSLAGYSPWGLKELDTTEPHTHTHTHTHTHAHQLTHSGWAAGTLAFRGNWIKH